MRKLFTSLLFVILFAASASAGPIFSGVKVSEDANNDTIYFPGFGGYTNFGSYSPTVLSSTINAGTTLTSSEITHITETPNHNYATGSETLTIGPAGNYGTVNYHAVLDVDGAGYTDFAEVDDVLLFLAPVGTPYTFSWALAGTTIGSPSFDHWSDYSQLNGSTSHTFDESAVVSNSSGSVSGFTSTNSDTWLFDVVLWNTDQATGSGHLAVDLSWTFGESSQTTSVPEPGTVVLLAFGLGSLLAKRRKE